MYSVDYFISKFSAIPRKEWKEGDFGSKEGPKCALGHCGQLEDEDSGMLRATHESIALNQLFMGHLPLSKTKGMTYTADNINDGVCPAYKQKTPKGRILAALNDIKNVLNPEYKNITKKLAVLPVDETADYPVKELV